MLCQAPFKSGISHECRTTIIAVDSDVGYDGAEFKVARYSFSGSTPPKFECKLRRHKQRFGEINTTGQSTLAN